MTTVQLTVNGEAHRLDIDVRRSLLDLLRETLDLTGTIAGRPMMRGAASSAISFGASASIRMTAPRSRSKAKPALEAGRRRITGTPATFST
jgi:aerobic-type carbon monoxide dehydrogenase small subunit (CoxS/CutS family)